MHGHIERAAKMNGRGIVLGNSRNADGGKRQCDFCFLARPIKIVGLGQIEIKLEGLRCIGGIAWLYGGDFTVKPVESRYRLAEFFPLRLRSAAKGDPQREFIVAANEVAKVRCELAQFAYLGVDFDALRGQKRRILGSFDNLAFAIGRHQQRRFVAQ